MEEHKIRVLSQGDIDFAVAQMEREGWASSRRCFEAIVEHSPDGCFVAEAGGAAVGMVTATGYSSGGWVGNLIVTPEHRRKGLGARLVELAIEHLEGKGIGAIRLEADPPGINIYRRLGFQDEFESLRFKLARAHAAGASARRLDESGLEAVARYDSNRFGDDRSRFLSSIYPRSKSAFVCGGEGGVLGYLMVMSTVDGFSLGPFVAEDPSTASSLIETALADCEDKPVTVGLPASNRDGVALLCALGFEQTPSSYRMIRGGSGHSGVCEKVWGIASGAVG